MRPSVADPHHVYAELDPAFHSDLDPDPTFHSNADPEPTFRFEADADPEYYLPLFPWTLLCSKMNL
jgi:hypothetical protein